MRFDAIDRLPAILRLVLALVAGGLGALALAPFNFSLAILLPILAGFALLSGAVSRWRAFGLGWLIGFGYFVIALRWLVEPFQVEADIFGWMAPIALAMMAAGLSLFWGTAFAVAWRRGPVMLALAWTLAELGRAYLFTGFPWAGFPQALLDTPYQHLLAFVGPHGVTLILLLLIAVGMGGVRSLMGAVVIIVLLGFLLNTVPKSGVVAEDAPMIRVVQPNAPQHEKWDPDKWQIFFQRQLEATQARTDQKPDLIIWPETAIPHLLSRADDPLALIAQAAQGSALALGLQRRDKEKFHNSLAVLAGDGTVSEVYDKHHLVPFGEYMPFPGFFRSLGIAALAQRTRSGHAPGAGPKLVQVGNLSALPLICYEAVFPQNARSRDARPDFLLQITNDAWFGTYAGPQQHLAQARMRAIEQGLPMARSANTGISAIIGPRGEVIAALPLGQHGFVEARLPERLQSTVYARIGDETVAVLLFFALAAAFAVRHRKQNN